MKSLEQRWYDKPPLALLPLELFYRSVISVRHKAYQMGLLSSTRLPVPVVVVGNINVGGTGKTPLTIWLVKLLKQAGYTPGIITRGYGGQAQRWPQQVRADSDPFMVGDEPVIMAQRCDCPVVAGPDRVAAAQALLQHNQCDILISDDGMQHYRLQRDIEITVIDGQRRFGNNHCLPVGPLREPVKRLTSVDFIVANGEAGPGEHGMGLVQGDAVSLSDSSVITQIEEFVGKCVHAVAGIGNPNRFFSQLREKGIEVVEHPFPDHHAYEASDLEFGDSNSILMTEKDAIKCRRFAQQGHWYVPVEAQLDKAFAWALLEKIKRVYTGSKETD